MKRWLLLMGLFLFLVPGWSQVTRVKKDRPGLPAANEALLLFRLRVIDPTNRYASPPFNNFFPFLLAHRIEEKNGGLSLSSECELRAETATGFFSTGALKEWHSVEGEARYEEPVACLLKPGRYYLKAFKLMISPSSGSPLFFYAFFDRVLEAAPGSVINLGAVEVQLPDAQGKHSVSGLRIEEPDRQETFRAIQTRFPVLAGEVASRQSAPRLDYFLLENFPGNANPREWPVEYWGGGDYCVIQKDPGNTSWQSIPLQDVPASVAVEVECHWGPFLDDGDPQQPYGLILGADNQTFLAFVVSSKGNTGVLRRTQGKWGAQPIAWQPGSTPFGKKSVLLRVERHGAHYRFLVNGNPVGEFEDAEHLPILRSGFLTAGKQCVTYERLLAQSLPE